MKKLLVGFLFITTALFSQEEHVYMNKNTFKGLKFRNIGPAFASGRIADIAIHPDDENCWYVAVGSGGVWKTINAGVTWTPIFDSLSVYSTGCITIDPIRPHTIWVGTGENVGGRHVGYGDGIYKSIDDGKTWKNMGLVSSEHISKIIVHPEDPDIVYAAAQGPLWNDGGDRGLYKSTDGGNHWKKLLGDNQWTGVTDLVMDPGDPEWLYAATWQRHRNVAAYMGGGPGSGIHRTSDGGETWVKMTEGIPGSNLGKIGLAISPFNSDVIYAAISKAVAESRLWLVNGPATVLGEEIPAGVLSDAARLRQPPPSVPAPDLLPANLPEAWSDGKTTALSVAAALAQKNGFNLPWKTVREAITSALNARFLELAEGSAYWPCDYPAAGAVTLVEAKAGERRGGGAGLAGEGGVTDGTSAPGVRVGSSALEPHELQDLVDAMQQILEVKAQTGVPVQFHLRVEVGETGGADPTEAVEQISMILGDIKDDWCIQ